nr:LysE family translocator [Kocuria sp. JC486]
MLIPGVDFFLIVRTSLRHGRVPAAMVCVGIALANALFISAAFAGLGFITNPVVLSVFELVGGGFLTYVGVQFFRADARATVPLEAQRSSAVNPQLRWRLLGTGFASGLLNPKNALFYVSLAAAVAPAPAGSLIFYGTWMFTVVLTWDLLLAFALGAPRTLGALQRVLPWISATAGLVLVALGVTMVIRGLTAL